MLVKLSKVLFLFSTYFIGSGKIWSFRTLGQGKEESFSTQKAGESQLKSGNFCLANAYEPWNIASVVKLLLRAVI